MRIDFLHVQSALRVTIVDCHPDHDLEIEAHSIKIESRPIGAKFVCTAHYVISKLQ